MLTFTTGDLAGNDPGLFVTVKRDSLVADPPAVVTVMSPVALPLLGTQVVIDVGELTIRRSPSRTIGCPSRGTTSP